jgi:glycosyltransferase involved in cell wall biosynthesis
MGIRLAVIDDNPHLSWEGRTYPVNATFNRFVSALLDVPGPEGRPYVERIDDCIPLRPATEPPVSLPLDPRIDVVGTTPFDGIAGYLRHAPSLVRRNAAIVRPVIRASDLVWLKVPASNAPLAAVLARFAGVPRFGYVAGSAADVAAGQPRGGLARVGARVVGRAYDGLGRLSSVGGDRVVVGRGLGVGGIVTSLVEPAEIRPAAGRPWPARPGHLRLAWAGRLVEGKGLEELLTGLAILAAEPLDDPAAGVRLTLIGDGPARASLAAFAAKIGVTDRIDWRGFVADRGPYLEALAEADVFVFPSPAEGFPKVVLDAMAVGLPVLAAPSGELDGPIAAGAVGRIAPNGPGRAANGPGIASAVDLLVADPVRVNVLRRAGTELVTAHTRPAEAARLVDRWRERWPELPWG